MRIMQKRSWTLETFHHTFKTLFCVRFHFLLHFLRQLSSLRFHSSTGLTLHLMAPSAEVLAFHSVPLESDDIEEEHWCA